MAKKKESFVLSAEPEDLGVMEYGFGQGGKLNKQNTGERAKTWRSPHAIFLYLVAGFLLFWFLYSVIAAAVRNGAQAILSYAVDFMALAVCLAIIFLSVFKGWGKFARFALRHNLVKSSERASVEDSAEMMEEAYEKLEMAPPVFEVYANYIRATDGYIVKTFDRSRVRKITAYKLGGQCIVNIVSDGEVVGLKGLRLPMREVKKLQTVLGDVLSVEPLIPEDEKQTGTSKLREGLSDVNWPGIIMGLIAFAVGCGVIALHYTLAESIPIALGAFFMAGGVLIFFTGFASFPIAKVFIIPLIAGGIFITIPYQFCKIIGGEEGIAFLFSSADNFFSSFNALYCIVVLFIAVGVIGVIAAFTGLYKYIKYGEY